MKRYGYESGDKLVQDLKPPPRRPGIGAKRPVSAIEVRVRTVSEGQLELGEALRDEGMRAVSEHVDRDWRDAADAEILRLARTGERFTVDDVREVVGEPDRVNAWGARFNSAAKHRLIFFVGFTKSHRAPRHAGMIRVWRGTTKAMGGGQTKT